MLDNNKFRYREGVTADTLATIRDWDYGILMISSYESRGIDTRFKKDAIVLIVAQVENHAQYLQMIGRSSRSRNLCEAILYVQSVETAKQVLDRLSNQNAG